MIRRILSIAVSYVAIPILWASMVYFTAVEYNVETDVVATFMALGIMGNYIINKVYNGLSLR